MHQQIDEPRDIVRVTDNTTKAELEEAITSHRATLARMPAHWTDRRAALHAKIDAMLADWERAPDPRVDGRPATPDA
jgi:hypothetical protein